MIFLGSDSLVDPNILKVFLSHKNALDNIRTTYLASKSRVKSPFSSTEEAELSRAAVDADKKFNAYTDLLNAAAKPKAREANLKKVGTSTENGLKKFMSKWDQKLRTLYTKAKINVVSACHTHSIILYHS